MCAVCLWYKICNFLFTILAIKKAFQRLVVSKNQNNYVIKVTFMTLILKVFAWNLSLWCVVFKLFLTKKTHLPTSIQNFLWTSYIRLVYDIYSFGRPFCLATRSLFITGSYTLQTRGFLMFLGGTKRDQWCEMG